MGGEAVAGVLRCAAVQCAPVPGRPDANTAAAVDLVARLGDRADIVVLPEMFLTGYVLDRRLEQMAQEVDGPAITGLRAAAARHRTLVVCGFPERSAHGVHNSAVVIDRDGAVAGVYRKTHLFGAEPDVFRAGDRLPVFSTSLGLVGVLICYDIEFPEPARVLALGGARVLLVPTANMHPYAEQHAVYARARAMENGVPVVVANQVGAVGGLRMCGGSRIVPALGTTSAAPLDEPAVLVREVALDEAAADPSLRYLPRRRTDLYPDLGAGRGGD